MTQVTISQIQALIEEAKALSESGHSFLDRRWREDGPDGRNHCYRRDYYRFCMLLARQVKPKLIVELGIDEGDCCGHWAFGAPKATVIGVDVHKDVEAPSIIARSVESTFANFKYHRAWSWEAVRTLSSEIKSLGGIDILYIDSWHEYDYFARDWNDWSPLLNEHALVLVDDLQLGDIARGFTSLPGKKLSDSTMNPAVPLGIMIRSGEKLNALPFKQRDFMS